MARSGDDLTNPITGDRVVFRTVREDLCEIDFFIHQTRALTEPHFHAIQSESFEVISGHGRWMLNGVEYDLHPGDRVEVAPGVNHLNPWRVGDEVLHIVQRNWPGLDFDVYFETSIKAAQRGKADAQGRLDLLHQAVILHGTRSKSYLSTAPVWLQRALFPLLAALGRLKGYQFRYQG